MNRGLLSLFILLLSCTICRAGGDFSFNYQAKLTDNNGAPLTGSHTLYFWVFAGGTAEDLSSGTPIYAESAILTATNGIVNHAVGSQIPSIGFFSPALFSVGNTYFLQVAVDQDTNTIVPRTPIKSVPMALKAANASSADSVPWEGITLPPGDLVDGASVSNIVTVAKSGAQFTSVQAALDSIDDAATTNPYLVKIAPGIYEENVVMKAFVDIAGSGDNNTTITADADAPTHLPTVAGAADCELRDISINNNRPTISFGIDTNQSMRFRNIAVTTLNPGSQAATGIRIGLNARASLKNVAVIVTNPSPGAVSSGVSVLGHADIDGLYCHVTGYNATGVYQTLEDRTLIIRNSRIYCFGHFAIGCNTWSTGLLENSTLSANATSTGSGFDQTYVTSILRNCVIAGTTNTVRVEGLGVVRLTGCTLQGGPVDIDAGSIITCTNCEDENFVPNTYPTCP